MIPAHFPRRHELAKLRDEIKTLAADVRQARAEARLLSGIPRWEAQDKAKNDNIRILLLTYGLLRGRSLSRMESLHSDPRNFPSWDQFEWHLNLYFPEERAEQRAEQLLLILKFAKAEHDAWQKTLVSNKLGLGMAA